MEIQQIAQEKSVIAFARSAKNASGILARLTDIEKNAALALIAERIKERTSEILAANKKDVEAARPMVDWLTLDYSLEVV